MLRFEKRLQRKVSSHRTLEMSVQVDRRAHLVFVHTPALRLASAKLPVKSEFITLKTPPRLGSLVLESIPPANATASGGVGPNGAAVAEQMPEMTHESSKHVVNGGRSDRRI